MRRIPLLYIAAGLVAGILLFGFLPLNIWLVTAALLIAVILLLIKNTHAVITYFSVVLGIVTCLIHEPTNVDIIYDNRPIALQGEILNIKEGRFGQQLTVKLISGDVNNNRYNFHNANILLNLFEFETPFQPFDIIAFHATIKPQLSSEELPGDPDYSNYYYYNDIVGSAFTKTSDMRVIGRSASISSKIRCLNRKAYDCLASTTISSGCLDFLDTVLLGNADEISLCSREIFSQAGLAHVLALSGTHVAILSSFVLILLCPLRLFGWRAAVYIAVAAFLWFYAFLTGLSPSVLRAVIMISVVFLARITSRSNTGLNALCLAAIIILIATPRALYSPSFQLTFCAVASILLFGEAFHKIKLHDGPTIYISGIIFATVAALVGTALLSAYYFHRFPIYSLLANLPATLLLPLIIALGTILLLMSLLNLHLTPLDRAIDGLYNAFEWCARFFAELPHSTIDNIYFNGLTLLPYFCCVVLLALFLCYRKKTYIFSSLLFLIACAAIFTISSSRPEGDKLYITGDSRGTDIIIDTQQNAYAVSTRHTLATQNIARLNNIHSDFLNRRGLKTFIDVRRGTSPCREIEWTDNTLRTGNIVLTFVEDESDIDSTEPYRRANYALITRTCRRIDPVAMAHKLKADTILLPKELNARYAKDYQDSLRRHNIPFRNLRSQRLWISINQ